MSVFLGRMYSIQIDWCDRSLTFKTLIRPNVEFAFIGEGAEKVGLFLHNTGGLVQSFIRNNVVSMPGYAYDSSGNISVGDLGLYH